jgi:hypothetical protein
MTKGMDEVNWNPSIILDVNNFYLSLLNYKILKETEKIRNNWVSVDPEETMYSYLSSLIDSSLVKKGYTGNQILGTMPILNEYSNSLGQK